MSNNKLILKKEKIIIDSSFKKIQTIDSNQNCQVNENNEINLVKMQLQNLARPETSYGGKTARKNSLLQKRQLSLENRES